MQTESKKYAVLGIGNAIVDIFANVDDKFLDGRRLEKGTTRLINKAEAEELCRIVTVSKMASGGSAANTIAGLASLGNKVAFIGKVKADRLGDTFVDGLIREGIASFVKKCADGPSTARCIVLVTPDAERTMNTYLGIAGSLKPDDIDEEAVNDSAIIYIEGYLLDRGEAKEAILKTFRIAEKSGGKIAISLSDQYCVKRNRKDFLDLIGLHPCLLFANEEEIKCLFHTDSLDLAIESCRKMGVISAVTRGANGSIAASSKELHHIPAEKVSRIIDTTGAGDLYAAGFLHGFAAGCNLKTCGRLGSIAAAEVISHFGARSDIPLKQLFESRFIP